MESMSKLVAQGAPGALKMVKSLLDTPTLINPGFFGTLKQGLPFFVQIQTESHVQQGDALVSESLVIAKGKKANIADNVAPGPWEWNLSGYILGMPSLELTNLFTPFVTLNTTLLKNAFKKGYILTFKDVGGAIYKRVAIKRLSIKTEADTRNAVPFSMTLKEINMMDVLAPNLDALADDLISVGTTMATSLAGQALGQVASMI